MGDTRGFRPFGADNLRWGLDAPTRRRGSTWRSTCGPGSEENPVNPGSTAWLAVALLGSESFDVMDVDPESLALGVDGAAAAHRAYVTSDANSDGCDGPRRALPRAGDRHRLRRHVDLPHGRDARRRRARGLRRDPHRAEEARGEKPRARSSSAGRAPARLAARLRP